MSQNEADSSLHKSTAAVVRTCMRCKLISPGVAASHFSFPFLSVTCVPQTLSVSRELGFALHEMPLLLPKNADGVARTSALPHQVLQPLQMQAKL